MKSILNYPELIDATADELFRNLENYSEAHLRRLFFVERKADADRLAARLFEVNTYGGNVLVVGEPGVGKSVFLNDFLSGTGPWAPYVNSVTNFIDLRKVTYHSDDPDSFFDQFLLKLGTICIQHFDKVFNDPCNDSPDRETNGLKLYNWVANKISKISDPIQNPETQSHYIFIDDVDYLPDSAFARLLEYLSPFLQSHYFCVILACRIPAYNAIQCHWDTNVTNGFLDSKKLILKSIDVHLILEKRLSDVFENGTSLRQLIKNNRYLSSFRKLFSVLKYALSSGGDDTDISFEYPFTQKQHHFMSMNSNGNCRQVLEMAKHFLWGMKADTTKVEKTAQGYKIGRERMLEIFTDSSIPENIRIININSRLTSGGKPSRGKEKRSEDLKGNSIDLLVMEMIHRNQYPNIIDSTVFGQLNDDYGVSKEDAEASFQRLARTALIRPRVLRTRIAQGSELPTHDYELTQRGEYYFDYLTHWNAYIALFGSSKHRINYRSSETIERIETAVIMLASSLLVYVKTQMGKHVDFKANKVNLTSYFCRTRAAFLLSLNETTKQEKLEFTTALFEHYLESRLGIIANHKLEDSRNFLFLSSDIEKTMRERKIPLQLHQVYDEDEFHTEMASIISFPDYV